MSLKEILAPADKKIFIAKDLFFSRENVKYKPDNEKEFINALQELKGRYELSITSVGVFNVFGSAGKGMIEMATIFYDLSPKDSQIRKEFSEYEIIDLLNWVRKQL